MIQIFYFFTWSMFFKLMLLLLFEWTKKNKFKFSHFCCCCRRFDWTTTTLDIGLWSKIRRKNVFFLASLLSFCRRCCRKFHSQLMVVGQKVHLSGSNFFLLTKNTTKIIIINNNSGHLVDHHHYHHQCFFSWSPPPSSSSLLITINLSHSLIGERSWKKLKWSKKKKSWEKFRSKTQLSFECYLSITFTMFSCSIFVFLSFQSH